MNSLIKKGKGSIMDELFGFKIPVGSVLLLTRRLVVPKAESGIEAVVNGVEDEYARMDYAWSNPDSYRILVETCDDLKKGLRTFTIVRFRDRESKEMFVMKWGLMGGKVSDLVKVIPGRMN
jgi:hypothetical protein